MVSPSSTDASAIPRRGAPVLRILVSVAVCSVITLVAVLAGAGPASAHAVPVSSSPSDRSHVATAPTNVSVTFNEAVTTEVGGLTVLDRAGERVDQGSSSQPSPTTIATDLKPDLPSGTYIANYKAISADGHPVSGSIVFAVGDATIDATAANSLATSSDPYMDVLSKVGQFLTYLGALLAAGLAFFIQFLHDGGDERPRLGRIVSGGAVVGVIGIASALLAQGALATSSGLTVVFSPSTLRGILGQGLGWQDLGLLIGLSLCVASVMVRHRVTAQALAFYGALITTASFVLWGHALESTRTWLTVPADITHVVAAAVWLGGLVGVAVVLRSRIGHLELDAVAATPGRSAPIGEAGEISSVATVGSGQIEPGGTALLVADPPSDERANLRSTVAIVSRFSTVAAASLILLSVAGVALGWTETGSIAGLTTTTYGRLLLAKVAVVLVIAFIAGYNRFFLLPWLFQDTDDVEGAATAALVASPTDAIPVGSIEPPRPVEPMDLADGVEPAEVDDPDELRAGWRSLLNTVRFEAVLIVVVLALTAVLTNTPPGTTSVDTEIFQEAQPFRGGQVTLTITPNTVGPNAFHVDMVDADHHGADLGTRVTVELTMPANNIGPITREMLEAGTGHFILDDVDDLAVAGTWQIVLVIRVSDFEQERLTFQDDVR